jgi:hypothetical protein
MDHMVAAERKRVMNFTVKTKEIMALNYANEKNRLNVQKKLEKKQ